MSGVRRLSIAVLMSGAISVAMVPTADADTIVNLTTGGSGSSNGALYQWTDFGPTGTGNIDSFVRIQNNGIEQGYNHSLGGQVPWDTKAGIFTHDIQMKDLVLRNVLGIDYFEFLLDINESSGHDNEFLSLDNVRIFTRDGAISSGPEEDFSDLGTSRFDSDAGADGDTTVVLDYSLNNGSGSGDMFMYIPVSLFAGTMPEDYVYFYSLFGNLNSSDAGFEEWALLPSTSAGGGSGGGAGGGSGGGAGGGAGGGVGGGTNNTPVPEPGSMLLLGSGLAFAVRRIRQA